jgi:uncharacterized membrane protein YvlD (DUF360 family)
MLLVFLLDTRLVTGSLWVLVLVGLVLGLANTAARPVYRSLELPLNPLTLGAFILAANLGLLVLLATVLGGSFDIAGVLWYAIATLVIAVVTTVINVVVGD